MMEEQKKQFDFALRFETRPVELEPGGATKDALYATIGYQEYMRVIGPSSGCGKFVLQVYDHDLKGYRTPPDIPLFPSFQHAKEAIHFIYRQALGVFIASAQRGKVIH